MTAAAIGGWVDYDFEPVLDAFAENFDKRGREQELTGNADRDWSPGNLSLDA